MSPSDGCLRHPSHLLHRHRSRPSISLNSIFLLLISLFVCCPLVSSTTASTQENIHLRIRGLQSSSISDNSNTIQTDAATPLQISQPATSPASPPLSSILLPLPSTHRSSLITTSFSVLSTRTTPSSDPSGVDGDDVVTFWPNFYAKFVSACYLVLCLASCMQLTRTIVHRHKIQSFRFGFLLVCFLWTLLRVIFWFFVGLHTWELWLSNLIYLLPNACQIGTFALLILFYAKLVHRHRWRVLRLRFLGFCILSNIAMVLLTLTFSILLDRVQKTEHDDPTSTDAADVKEFVYKMYYISSAAFFGVLVVLATFYLYMLRSVGSAPAGTSKQEVLVTSFIFLIFLSRCIWDLMAAFDSSSKIFRHAIWETTTSPHVKLMNSATFILLILWEVIPTMIIIVYFRNIPNTSDSYCVGAWSCLQKDGRSSTCGNCMMKCLRGWPCYFPEEYFEQIENSNNTDDLSHDGNSIRHTQRERLNLLDDPYSENHEESISEVAAGASSSLPPGTFVRTASLSQSQNYSLNGAQHPYGRSYTQAGSVKHGSLGVNGHQDLYGSPTWLNPTHPALTQLMPSSSLPSQQHHPASLSSHAQTSSSHHLQYTQAQLQAQQQNHQQQLHPSSQQQLQQQQQQQAQQQQQQVFMHAHSHYDDEEDDEYAAQYSIHPYTQQFQGTGLPSSRVANNTDGSAAAAASRKSINE